MKIIIDDAVGKPPMIFITKDKDLINSVLHTLNMSDIRKIIPESAILAYRKDKENHIHLGGNNNAEIGELAEEVVSTVIEVMKR